MRVGNYLRPALLALVAASGAALAPVALAQSVSQPTDEHWDFHLASYGYFPSNSGRLEFPSNMPGSTFGIDAGTLVDSLKFRSASAPIWI
jgi:hypothetical protein